MLISVLRVKIHRATVTDANLEYEGSLSFPFEQIHAYNDKFTSIRNFLTNDENQVSILLLHLYD